jgi:hypothetical protein
VVFGLLKHVGGGGGSQGSFGGLEAREVVFVDLGLGGSGEVDVFLDVVVLDGGGVVESLESFLLEHGVAFLVETVIPNQSAH